MRRHHPVIFGGYFKLAIFSLPRIQANAYCYMSLFPLYIIGIFVFVSTKVYNFLISVPHFAKKILLMLVNITF